MEPEILRRGKEFHNKVQADWEKYPKDGHLSNEHSIAFGHLAKGAKHIKRGRLDMFLNELGDFVTIIEIKSTNWDNIRHIRKLLASHRRQVWSYISKYLDDDGLNVCAGIIYPSAPKTPDLKDYIRTYFEDDYGIQVVWYDE